MSHITFDARYLLFPNNPELEYTGQRDNEWYDQGIARTTNYRPNLNHNAYATVEDADAQNAINPNNAYWADLTLEQKQHLLMQSALDLDSYFHWFGQKFYPSRQVMDFPRTGLYNQERGAIFELFPPLELVRASIALCYYINQSDRRRFQDAGIKDNEAVRVDVISFTRNDRYIIPKDIETMLQALGERRDKKDGVVEASLSNTGRSIYDTPFVFKDY